MKFTMPAGALREAVAQVRGAIPSTPSLVAYSGILFVADSDRVRLIGSDGETTLSASVAATGVKAGQVLLPPKPLASFLQTLTASRALTVELDSQGDVTVSAYGLNPYTFRPLTATYPLPSASTGKQTKCSLERLQLALSAVRPAVSRDTLAVQLVSSADGLSLHTTDTFRLCRVTLPEASFGDFRGVLPLPVLDRAARSEPTTVSVDSRTRMVTFASDAVSVSSRLLATPFPAVETVLDAKPAFSVQFDPKILKSVLARLLSVADHAPVRIRLEGPQMQLSASTADIGSGRESVDLHAPVAAPFEVLVKANYLLDAVSTFDCESVSLSYSGALQPLYLEGTDPFDLLQIVMPVRG